MHHAKFAAARGLAEIGEPGTRAIEELAASTDSKKRTAGAFGLLAVPAVETLSKLIQDDAVKPYAVVGLMGQGDERVPLLLAASACRARAQHKLPPTKIMQSIASAGCDGGERWPRRELAKKALPTMQQTLA